MLSLKATSLNVYWIGGLGLTARVDSTPGATFGSTCSSTCSDGGDTELATPEWWCSFRAPDVADENG